MDDKERDLQMIKDTTRPKTLDELLEEGKVKFKDIDMPKEKKSWWSW